MARTDPRPSTEAGPRWLPHAALDSASSPISQSRPRLSGVGRYFKAKTKPSAAGSRRVLMGRDRMDGTVELDKTHMEGTRKVLPATKNLPGFVFACVEPGNRVPRRRLSEYWGLGRTGLPPSSDAVTRRPAGGEARVPACRLGRLAEQAPSAGNAPTAGCCGNACKATRRVRIPIRSPPVAPSPEDLLRLAEQLVRHRTLTHKGLVDNPVPPILLKRIRESMFRD